MIFCLKTADWFYRAATLVAELKIGHQTLARRYERAADYLIRRWRRQNVR